MTSRTAACALAGLLMMLSGPAAFAQPNGGGHLRPDGHVMLAWLHGGSSAQYRAQVEQMPGVTVVAPTWWGLDGSDPGGVTDDGDPAFVAWAGERGLAVWPQLGNRLDAALTEAVLSDPARRARLVSATAAAVDRSGAGGVLVGFENLLAATGPRLTALVHELRAALPGRVVAVTVAPVTDTWSRGDWSAAYERRPLGEVADYVVLSAMDQHDHSTGPGPVAGLGWTLAAVERLLSTVPDHKILLGAPLYARSWVEDPTAPGGARPDRVLGMDAMARWLDAAGADHHFDGTAGQRRYTSVDAEGRVHVTWQEDVGSLTRRARLATAYNLGGMAGWRGGFAGPDAWSAISTVLAAEPRPTTRASGPPRLNRLVPVPRVADPRPQAAAGDTAEVLDGSVGQASGGGDPAGTLPRAPTVAAVLLLVVVAGALAGRGVRQRSSRSRASSALSSPPTSMDTLDR